MVVLVPRWIAFNHEGGRIEHGSVPFSRVSYFRSTEDGFSHGDGTQTAHKTEVSMSRSIQATAFFKVGYPMRLFRWDKTSQKGD